LTDENQLTAASLTVNSTMGEVAVIKQSANGRTVQRNISVVPSINLGNGRRSVPVIDRSERPSGVAAVHSSSGTQPLDKVQSCPKKVSWFSRLEKRLCGYLGSVMDEASSVSVSGVHSNSRVVEGNIDGGNEDPSVGSHVARGHMDGRSGGLVSHIDLGARARDISGSDHSSAESAVLVEGPENVDGLLWVGSAADYSPRMSKSKSVVCQNSRVERISVGFHRQPPKADVVRFVPANPVCQAPSCVTVTGNSCADSGCGTSDVDFDGGYGIPDIGSDGLLRSASQTVQPIVLPLCPPNHAANVNRAVSE